MDEHDLDGRALLIIVGGEPGATQPDREGNHGGGDEPRQYAPDQRYEPGRIGEVDQRHLCPRIMCPRTRPVTPSRSCHNAPPPRRQCGVAASFPASAPWA